MNRSERLGAGAIPAVPATVQSMLKHGFTWLEICKRIGCCRSTVAYHARKLRNGVRSKHAKRYDWTAISKYAALHTVRACMKKYGFSGSTWFKAIQAGRVVAKGKLKRRSVQDVAVENSTYGRKWLKRQIIDLNILPVVCGVCGCDPLWLGKPLVLRLDHKNGVNNDHRLSNLRFLCPNCDSQQPTYSGRNTGKQRLKHSVLCA